VLPVQLRNAIPRVVARAAELQETLEDEARARRDAAASWWLVSGDTELLLSALPRAARQGRREGRWLLEGEDARLAGRVALDAEERPLLHERADDGEVLALWRYDDDVIEEVRVWGAEAHVTWVLSPHGAVGADPFHRWAERWTWEGDQVARADHGSAAPRGWPHASATEAELDEAGAVRMLRSGSEESAYRDDNRLGEDEWLGALEAAVDRASALTCETVR
jgi:hypothetical protein